MPRSGSAYALLCAVFIISAAPASSTEAGGSGAKGFTSHDLLTLTDISTASISPDGSRIAFVTEQAVLERDSYESLLYVMDAQLGASPRVLGQVTPALSFNSGFVSRRVHWAQNGRTVTYIARFSDRDEVWAWSIDGGAPRRVSNATTDIVSHSVLPDQRTVWFTTVRIGESGEQVAAITDDARKNGMVFAPPVDWGDYLGERGVRRYVARTVGARFEHWLADLDTLQVRRVAASELASYPRGFPGSDEIDYELGDRLGTSPSHSRYPLVMTRDRLRSAFRVITQTPQLESAIVVGDSGGENQVEWIRGKDAGISALRWAPDGSSLIFYQHRVDDRGQRSGIYRISSAGNKPLPLYETYRSIGSLRSWVDDVISYDASVTRAVFVEAGPQQPGRLTLADLRTGKAVALYDPNPNVAFKKLRKPIHLTWTNQYGVKAYAYLVPPLDPVPGRKYPLVVVTYSAEGFLRGGTGDEYPVYPLAGAGFAVLVLDKGDAFIFPSEGSEFSLYARHWSGLATFREALRRASEFDFVDPSRTAVAGLSYGASVVWYALIASNLFQAAIVSDGGVAPFGLYMSGTDAAQHWYGGVFRVPLHTDEIKERWRRVGIPFNIDKVRAPVLINDADNEFASGLQVTSTMRNLGKPFELIVYPGAGHVISRPAQRLSIYKRNIDWLRFWLNGEEDPAAEKAEQYRRWRALREQHEWNERLVGAGENPANIFFEQAGHRASVSHSELAPWLRSSGAR